MEDGHKRKLEEKKALLKLQLSATGFFKMHVAEMLEWATALKASGVAFEIEYIYCLEERIPFLRKLLLEQQENFAQLSLLEHPDPDFHRLLEEQHPSVNALRYVPPFPVYHAFDDIGLEAVASLPEGFFESGQVLYLFYMPYAPVLRLNSDEFLQHIEEFAALPHDFCLVTKHLDKILVRTLEGDWHFHWEKNAGF